MGLSPSSTPPAAPAPMPPPMAQAGAACPGLPVPCWAPVQIQRVMRHVLAHKWQERPEEKAAVTTVEKTRCNPFTGLHGQGHSPLLCPSLPSVSAPPPPSARTLLDVPSAPSPPDSTLVLVLAVPGRQRCRPAHCRVLSSGTVLGTTGAQDLGLQEGRQGGKVGGRHQARRPGQGGGPGGCGPAALADLRRASWQRLPWAGLQDPWVEKEESTVPMKGSYKSGWLGEVTVLGRRLRAERQEARPERRVETISRGPSGQHGRQGFVPGCGESSRAAQWGDGEGPAGGGRVTWQISDSASSAERPRSVAKGPGAHAGRPRSGLGGLGGGDLCALTQEGR